MSIFCSQEKAPQPVFHRANFWRKQRKKEHDWLAANTDVITTQSHSCFALFARKWKVKSPRSSLSTHGIEDNVNIQSIVNIQNSKKCISVYTQI